MKAKDLRSRRFGRLVALRDVGSAKNGQSKVRVWECLCDCGVVKQVRSSQLLQGNVRSCGCLRSEIARERVLLPPGESGLNALYTHYQGAARRKGFDFTLTKEEFRKLTSRDCYYCGTPPAQKSSIPRGTSTYIHNGIDRYNNGLGYIAGNCVPCCSDCNFFKGARDGDFFLSRVRHIANYTREVPPLLTGTW